MKCDFCPVDDAFKPVIDFEFTHLGLSARFLACKECAGFGDERPTTGIADIIYVLQEKTEASRAEAIRAKCRRCSKPLDFAQVGETVAYCGSFCVSEYFKETLGGGRRWKATSNSSGNSGNIGSGARGLSTPRTLGLTS